MKNEKQITLHREYMTTRKYTRIHLLKCYICGREIEDVDNLPDDVVYHKSIGYVCLTHNGVKEWYEGLKKNHAKTEV